MKVFVHIGLPKTGTSYLQGILWGQRDRLREAGLHVPGRERRDHLWSSLVLREDPNAARRHPEAPGAWDVVRRDILRAIERNTAPATSAVRSHQ